MHVFTAFSQRIWYTAPKQESQTPVAFPLLNYRLPLVTPTVCETGDNHHVIARFQYVGLTHETLEAMRYGVAAFPGPEMSHEKKQLLSCRKRGT